MLPGGVFRLALELLISARSRKQRQLMEQGAHGCIDDYQLFQVALVISFSAS